MIQDAAGVHEELPTMKKMKVLMAWRYLESLWLGENFMEHGKESETKGRQKMRWEENVKK